MRAKQKKQTGQTLIETIAAVFVLSMGITAVVGLASYTVNASSNVLKQVVGIGLARQGIEAVKNMRDTNWLQQASINTNCFNYKNNEQSSSCFRNWLNLPQGYDLTGCATGCTVGFTPDSTDEKFTSGDIKFWDLNLPGGQTGYTLARKSLVNGSTNYFYYPATTTAEPQSGFYRSVTITVESSPTPYDRDAAYGVLRIISRVWWGDKKCPVPSASTYPTSGSCRVTLETILTNWKTN